MFADNMKKKSLKEVIFGEVCKESENVFIGLHLKEIVWKASTEY